VGNTSLAIAQILSLRLIWDGGTRAHVGGSSAIGARKSLNKGHKCGFRLMSVAQSVTAINDCATHIPLLSLIAGEMRSEYGTAGRPQSI
jgi:hypothetical protein